MAGEGTNSGESRRRYRAAILFHEPDTSLAMESRRLCLAESLSALLKDHSPDLVVLPEMCLAPDFDRLPERGAEMVDGPTSTLVSGIAERASTNICIPVVEDDGGRLFKTAV